MKEISEFYKKIFSNTELKKKITKEAKEITNEKDLRALIKEEIMPLVKKYKLNFSEEELLEYEEFSLKELTKEDLYNVSGGVNLKPLLLNGGLLSFALLGAGIANAPIANAVITKAQIEDACKSIENTNPGTAENDVQAPETSTAPQNDNANNNDTGTVTSTIMSKDVIASSAKSVRVDPFLAVYNKGYDLRDAYLLMLAEALKPLRFENGLTTYLNFEEADEGETPRAKWNDIHGPGFVNLMVKLFPSTAGQVCTGGGMDKNHPFSKHCHPVPELVAAIQAYLHNYVRTDNQEVAVDARQNLEKLISELEKGPSIEKCKEFERWNNETHFEINENELKITKQPSQRKRKLLQIYNSLVPPSNEIDSSKSKISNQELKKIYDVCKEKCWAGISDVESFCQKYLEYDIISHAKNQQIDVYPCALTLLHAVYDSTISIEQEKQGLLDPFTTERIWGCYFILQFDTVKEAIEYCDQLKKRIHNLPNLSEEEISKLQSDMENKQKLFGKIKVVNECPYTQTLVSNESAHLIKPNKNGTVCFENDTFQDCVETTTLQLMNLLMYNKKDEWSFILGDTSDEKIEQLRSYYKQVIGFMSKPNTENFEIGSFNDRFAANFVYQIDNGVENMSKEKRSLWNLALFNQTVKNGFAYDITYKRDNIKNEVKSGCLNMLKLIYNCVYKFKHVEDTPETSYELKLRTAKEKIDGLESAIKRNNSSDAKDTLKEALESTFVLFCDDVSVEISDDISFANNDCYVKANISKILGNGQDSKNSLEFILDQMDGHAYIRFNPVKVDGVGAEEKALIKYVKDNTITKLFSYKFGGDYEDDDDDYEDDKNSLGIYIDVNSERSPFFWSVIDIPIIDVPNRIQENQYLKNRAALQLLKKAQENPGDHTIIEEYINPLCRETNITTNKGSLSDFILDNYAITSDTAFYKFHWSGTPDLTLKSDDNEFYKYVKSKKLFVTDAEGNEYYCKKVKPDSTEVVIFPFVAPGTKKVKIPATVTFKGEQCQVVGIVNNFTINNIEEIELDEDIEKFKFGDYSLFESSITSVKLSKSLTSLNFGVYSLSEASLNELNFLNCNNLTDIKFEASSFEGANLKNGLNFSNLDNLTNIKFGTSSFEGANLKNGLNFSNLNLLANIIFEVCSFEKARLENGLIFSNLNHLTNIEFGSYSFKNYFGGIKFDNIKNLKNLSFGKYSFKGSKLGQIPFTIKQGEKTCPNGCVYNVYKFIPSILALSIEDSAFEGSFKDVPHPEGNGSRFTPIRLCIDESINNKYIDDFIGIDCIPFSYKSEENLKDKLDFLYRLYEYGILDVNCIDKLDRDKFIEDIKLLVENIDNKSLALFNNGKQYKPKAQEEIKKLWDRIKS